MSEDQVEEIKTQMGSKCEDFQGSPVLFELLDLSREYLTRSNIPNAAPCSICLYTFEEQDIFCKTKCFHHFHSYCIGRYLKCLIEEFNEKAKKEKIAGQYTHTSGNIQKLHNYTISLLSLGKRGKQVTLYPTNLKATLGHCAIFEF